jgi:hypothetical protein
MSVIALIFFLLLSFTSGAFILVKEFDPHTCTWSIVRTYGKSPVIDFLQSTILTFEHVDSLCVLFK